MDDHGCGARPPLRVANQYGLFAVTMPRSYKTEFQGPNNGEHRAPLSLSLRALEAVSLHGLASRPCGFTCARWIPARRA
jgi:hypothetical protein